MVGWWNVRFTWVATGSLHQPPPITGPTLDDFQPLSTLKEPTQGGAKAVHPTLVDSQYDLQVVWSNIDVLNLI